MTPQQIALVQDSFAILVPKRECVAALFYTKLFDRNPALRAMFPAELDEQGRKLMQVLATVVHSLHKIEILLPAVDDLARRHVGYGVREEHYAPVGEALLETLAHGLGDAYCAETRDAWSAAYDLLSGRMMAAAYCSEAAAA